MANDYSLVILVGRLTRDPELKYSADGGLPYTRLSLAVNRSVQHSDGTVRKSVSYIEVTVWRTQAETCCQFLRKGSSAMIVGTLQEPRSTDRSQVVADRVQFLDRRVEPSEHA